jgi:hypothetical protein
VYFQGTHDVCLLSSLKVCGVFVIGIVRCPLSLILNLNGLCGAHRWGDNSYILVNIYCKSTMDPKNQLIQSSQDVHVCGI